MTPSSESKYAQDLIALGIPDLSHHSERIKMWEYLCRPALVPEDVRQLRIALVKEAVETFVGKKVEHRSTPGKTGTVIEIRIRRFPFAYRGSPKSMGRSLFDALVDWDNKKRSTIHLEFLEVIS